MVRVIAATATLGFLAVIFIFSLFIATPSDAQPTPTPGPTATPVPPTPTPEPTITPEPTAPLPPLDMIDLFVVDKWEEWIIEGLNYSVHYEVCNRGCVSAPAGHDTALYIDGALVETQEVPVELALYECYMSNFTTVGFSGGYDNIDVCADEFDEVDEWDEYNCHYNFITALPDLWVYKYENWVVQGVNYSVHYQICNEGGITASAGHDAALYVDGVLIETLEVPVALAPWKAPWDCYNGWFNTTVDLSGSSDNVTVCVDEFDEVIEEAEYDNCRSNELIALPDLHPRKSEAWVVEGVNYTVYYEIYNWGDAVAPAGHDASLYVDGVLVETQEVPVEIAGWWDVYSGQFNTTVNLSGEEDHILVCADEFDEVVEAYEINCKENTWPPQTAPTPEPTMTPPGPSPTVPPNLPELEVWKWEEWIVEGVNYTVHYEIWNEGNVTAPAGHDAALYIDWALLETQAVPVALAPMDAYYGQFNTTVSFSGGFDEVRVCADEFDEVDEIDDYDCDDNFFSAVPDLEVWKWEDWIVEEINYTVHYEIWNWGDVTAPVGHDTALHVDGVLIETQEVPVALAPMDVYYGQFNTTINLSGLSDDVEVCADEFGEIAEDWEDNCELNTLGVAVTPTPPPRPGGGGGGGGGLPSLMVDAVDRTKSCSIDSDGIVGEDFEVASRDGCVVIHLSEGAQALDAEGDRLRYIDVTPVEPLPDPPEGHYVLAAFDFEPDGATFSLPLQASLCFNPEEIPDGMSAENIVIGVLDDETGEWSFIGGTVDTENNTITFNFNHFTVYGVLAAPAAPTATSSATTTPKPTVTPETAEGSGLSTGVLIGISIGAGAILGLIAGSLIAWRRKAKNQATS